MNYDASIRINPSLNDIASYEINTESFKRLTENVEKMGKIIADYYDPQRLKHSMESLRIIAQDAFISISPVVNYNYSDMIKSIRASFEEIAEAMNLSHIEMLQNIDFSKLFADSFYRERYSEASKMAFEYADEEVKSEEKISQEELLEIFNEQIEDEIGWQEKLYNKSQEFQRKYFVFYKIFVGIIFFLISKIAGYFLDLGMAYAFGNIVSEPKEEAPAIYYFDQRTEVNIINETDNYYFITYIDDDGNEVMGYSLKENIEFIPEESGETEAGSEDSTER